MESLSFCKSARNDFLRIDCILFADPEFDTAQSVGIQPIYIYGVIVSRVDRYFESFEK